MSLILIAAGGAAGAVARYGIAAWIQPRGGLFPWGTLAVNVLGSFLLGFALRYLEASAISAEWRQAATIGLLGAFTTFSTFSFEAVALAQNGDWTRAGGYVLASLVLAMVAVVAGLGVGGWTVRVGA